MTELQLKSFKPLSMHEFVGQSSNIERFSVVRRPHQVLACKALEAAFRLSALYAVRRAPHSKLNDMQKFLMRGIRVAHTRVCLQYTQFT